jgi:Arc/MetJ-type ribon-helix-helix transcriptional regulator
MPKPSRQLAAEAAAADRSASELVRELVGDFIERQRQAREHDAWFRAEVEQGLREADDPEVELIDHEEVAEGWRRMREQWAKKINSEAG